MKNTAWLCSEEGCFFNSVVLLWRLPEKRWLQCFLSLRACEYRRLELLLELGLYRCLRALMSLRLCGSKNRTMGWYWM